MERSSRAEAAAERITAERFLDVLGRLEVELFGRVRHAVQREAIVRLALAIDLAQHLSRYRQQRRQTVETMTAQVGTNLADWEEAKGRDVRRSRP